MAIGELIWFKTMKGDVGRTILAAVGDESYDGDLRHELK
jgi:hypothetical protein